ncbi:hypothetical protein AB0M44_25880 [Streptosporangium subroseum]|uniref:hypothetical protein n=1 Tax=Streptosporangium subroseum TaxID=106412 RepID=UPI003443E996
MGQLHHDDNDLTVTFFCKDPDSQGDVECDTFYSTDHDSWIVQGKRRGSKVAAQLVALAEDETFLELSGSTAEIFVRKYVKERHGIDLGVAPN